MKFFEDKENKRIVYLFLAVIVITALIFTMIYLWYNDQLTKEADLNKLEMSYLTNTSNNISLNNTIKQTSTTEDKGINQVSNLQKNTNLTNNTQNTQKSKEVSKTNEKTKSVPEEQYEGNEIETPEYILEFEAPIAGDIIKDFSEDTLVYSKTLDEWTTHSGIDIKAEKTSVVKASEKGKIESIKNDPRYGLTVIIDHDGGYKTIYSNLLSTEFATIGDTVEKGQTIGTVGQSASFEIADEPHLHFEMYKDGVAINPTLYLK